MRVSDHVSLPGTCSSPAGRASAIVAPLEQAAEPSAPEPRKSAPHKPAPTSLTRPAVEVPAPSAIDRFAAARTAIARSEASPEDAALFRAASAMVRAEVRAAIGADPADVERWDRLLELAELSYDHAALVKIVDEVSEHAR